ncbi:MAG: dUTPase [Sulfurovum sp.]|nr:dUTPase [Sulfurovum sp.]
MNKIEIMLNLQQQLNDSTNGTGWENGMTKNGKIIDWRRCIYLEAAELVESYPWKHWKNIDAQADYENIKIEAVDIWHFVMSEALRLYKIEQKGSILDLTNVICREDEYNSFCIHNNVEHVDYDSEIKIVEAFIKVLFCDESIETIVSRFFSVAKISGLSLDTLYALYIGKNILNQFRQDHGYKEGDYIKVWDDKEDNVIMQEILNHNHDISPEELYSKLKEAYIPN